MQGGVSEEVEQAIDSLFTKAAILAELRNSTDPPETVVKAFSEFNGYFLSTRESCISYLQRKPKGKWVMMTDMKIGDEIIKLTLPTDDEMPEWAKGDDEGSILMKQLQASVSRNPPEQLPLFEEPKKIRLGLIAR